MPNSCLWPHLYFFQGHFWLKWKQCFWHCSYILCNTLRVHGYYMPITRCFQLIIIVKTPLEFLTIYVLTSHLNFPVILIKNELKINLNHDRKNSVWRFEVSKSQKQNTKFFHPPKNQRNLVHFFAQASKSGWIKKLKALYCLK